jgi:HEAT repeat protein
MGMGRFVGVLLVLAAGAAADDVVWLDGRREKVERVVVKGDTLLLPFEKGVRSVAIRRVVQVVGKDGEEVALDRALRDRPLGAEETAALASLPAADEVSLRAIQDRLADTMSRAVFDRLAQLAKEKKADLRARAGETLLLMGTGEALRAGLDVAIGDVDADVRRRVASALFQVGGALRTEGLADRVAEGLADRNAHVKTTCALALARLGDGRARDVLKASGLASGDHHLRESAAEALAELGDDAGVTVLIGMLTRTKHPAGPDLPAKIALEEKIRVCGLLGTLKAKRALDALKKAARAKEPELAAAAQRAIDAIGT